MSLNPQKRNDGERDYGEDSYRRKAKNIVIGLLGMVRSKDG